MTSLKPLANHLERGMHTVQTLIELMNENAALRGSTPGPFLDEQAESAMLDALIRLSSANFEDFCKLMDSVEVPNG